MASPYHVETADQQDAPIQPPPAARSPNGTTPAPRPAPQGGPRRSSRIERTDDAEAKAMLEALKHTIRNKQQRLEEIRDALDGTKNSRGPGRFKSVAFVQQHAAKSRLAELRHQLRQLEAQKNEKSRQLAEVAEARQRAKASLKEMSRGSRFARVDDIDAQIAELEERLAAGGLAEGEQHRVQEQIQALNKSRSHVAELRSKTAELKADSSAEDELREGLKRLEASMAKVKNEEEAQQEALAAQQKSSAHIAGLLRERAECRAILKAANEKREELRAELDAQWGAYKQQRAELRERQQAARSRMEGKMQAGAQDQGDEQQLLQKSGGEEGGLTEPDEGEAEEGGEEKVGMAAGEREADDKDVDQDAAAGEGSQLATSSHSAASGRGRGRGRGAWRGRGRGIAAGSRGADGEGGRGSGQGQQLAGTSEGGSGAGDSSAAAAAKAAAAAAVAAAKAALRKQAPSGPEARSVGSSK